MPCGTSDATSMAVLFSRRRRCRWWPSARADNALSHDSQRDPPGHHLGALVRMAVQTERAGRDGIDGKAADLVDRDCWRRVFVRLNFDRSLLSRDDLADQGIVSYFELNGQVRRGECQRPDRCGLRPHASEPVLLEA